ncbi:MAG: cysteine synthase A [Granulosicoccus sp.]|jgi:cysteine synthase A
MADSFSIKRKKLMRFLGARVVLTPRAEKGFDMYQDARELCEVNDWFLAAQFETEANAENHENTTGREIRADFDGQPLDYWVTGHGTSGTLTGVACVFRKHRSNTQIILSEPANAQLLCSGHTQERTDDGAPRGSHPAIETTLSRIGLQILSLWSCRSRSTITYTMNSLPLPVLLVSDGL